MTLDGYRRYAIYTAPSGPLGRFGSAWLGWDAEAGSDVPHPEISGLPRPASELTATPRKYGFHGTMKPPFQLADGCSGSDLDAALAGFAAGQPAVGPIPLALTRIGPFLALTPRDATPALDALAAATVREFDRFRAPPRPDELARRRAAGLSARQQALMAKWGYPYVMEEFRFHLTLTGRLSPEDTIATETALAPYIAPLLEDPYPLGDLALFGEAPDGRFHMLRRHRLTGNH